MTQAEALRILQTGASALITGEPGSGKTHLVNEYVGWLHSHGIEPAVTASTGIAATHIGGTTIHSWSGIGIKESLSDSDVEAIAEKEHVARRIGKTHVLIIDEISMLSGNVLDMVDRVVREIKRDDRAFGGMQVLLVGDFFQLPPISKGNAEVSFAFESEAFTNLHALILYLTEQHRQEDIKFVSLLTSIRSGESDHTHVSTIMTRETEHDGVGEDIPRLYTHNADVDKINAEKLHALPGKSNVFLMETTGGEFVVETLKRGCLSPERLELKEGAVVMCTKNNPLVGYSNGTVGSITGFELGTGRPILQTRDGKTITLEPLEWTQEENGKIKGKVTQIPLRLAWAITIHKSQGMSMDAAAIDLSRAFEYGQGYVALSRLRTLAGLSLLGFNENALAIHPRVRAVDEGFRESSREAGRVFGALFETEEYEKLQKNFILSCGGTLEASTSERKIKKSTFEETRALIQTGKTLAEVAKARKLTFGTIVDHAEKLIEGRLITSEEVIVPEALEKAFPAIFKAYEKHGTERLSPIFIALKKKYSYDDIRLARIKFLESVSKPLNS